MSEAPYSKPAFAAIVITESCNMRCAHCYGYYAPEKFNRMEYETFRVLVDALVQMGVVAINITGGDPLMHPDFIRMAEYVSKQPVAWSFLTNGSLVTDRMADEVARFRPGFIQVSIDGGSDETFRLIRGWPLEKVKEGVRKFTARGLRVLVNSVLHKQNAQIAEIESLMAFCSEAGVERLSYAFLEPIGRAYAYYRGMAPSPEEFELVARRYPDIVAHESGDAGLADAPEPKSKDGGSVHGCSPGVADISVNVDGQLGPCTYYRISSLFRDVKGLTAEEIINAWRNSPAFVFARAKTATYKCVMQDRCRIFKEGLCMRCQAMSFEHFGDPYAPHPWCVMYYKELGFEGDKYMEELFARMQANDQSGRLAEPETDQLLQVEALEGDK
jgi:MoaA/NifB/PqqE/SkfB family radical SAM enzyme